MAIKIFISSVFREFEHERHALQELIGGLQVLFVGMEVFGSDPGRPASYCAQKVRESDLYVGLFGHAYGSVDELSGKSFTEVEYDAAIDGHVPCLIYFKADAFPGKAEASRASDEKQAELVERLRRAHVAGSFKDTDDLKYKFLIDFIKLLRGTLFDKAGPLQPAPFPANALQSVTQVLIGEQVKAVGQDKYIPEIYIEREATKEIETFVNFEETFLARADQLLGQLEVIANRYRLSERVRPHLSLLRNALKTDPSPEATRRLIEELKAAFYFAEVDEALRAMQALVLEPSDRQYDLLVQDAIRHLAGKPFVDAGGHAELADTMFELRRQSAIAGALQVNSTAYKELLTVFPADRVSRVEVYAANGLLTELARLNDLNAHRCVVLVDRAGRGKTNVMCHLAKQLAARHPAILLSGQLNSRDEFAIEAHVQRVLESEFKDIFSDWMNRVSPSLLPAHKWLLILIDGINENSDLPRLLKALKGFLPRTESRRVKLVLSCRDLFWDYFQPALKPFLFDGKTVALDEFTEREWHRAVEGYFKHFDISCELDRRAEEALHNPLLLRFFCEAHKGQRLGNVINLRLLSIFDLYIERINENISQRSALLRTDAVISLLLRVAGAMWGARRASAELEALGVTPQEASDAASVFNQVISENIILGEATHAYSMRKSVRFLYDEFMEYMVARHWIERLAAQSPAEGAAEAFVAEAVEAMSTFPAAFGAIFFFDQMMKRDGALINQAIIRIAAKGDAFMSSQQVPLLYAFENINFAGADEQLLAVLERFERSARNEVKERLAPVILKLMRRHPEHPFVRRFVDHIFGKGTGLVSLASRQPPQPPPDGDRSSVAGKRREAAAARPGASSPGGDSFQVKCLPPSRYHYAEETKLNAIGVLVSVGRREHYALIRDGIRGLGQTDLHSALKALEYLDLADDEFVYSLISDYLKVSQPEYRIYCAWLLRRRYGGEPAEFLVRLLTDEDTRVHRYAYSIFDERGLEVELVERALRELESHAGMKSWHLLNLVKLLGRRSHLRPSGLADSHGRKIVEGLSKLWGHGYASIRLNVYRSMLNYREFVDLPTLLSQMYADSDTYVLSLAHKLTR